jgi:hypothetical protein
MFAPEVHANTNLFRNNEEKKATAIARDTYHLQA